MAVRTREITMPTTKKDQVVEHFIGEIRAGRLRPGDPLPTAREIREAFGFSITPVREAINHLKLLGYVVGVPGVRVYVADHPPD